MTEHIINPTFQELRELAKFTREPDRQEEGRELLIRYLDAHNSIAEFTAVVNSLCIHFGLYPYMRRYREHLSTAEALAVELHRPNVDIGKTEFLFHSEQLTIFDRLMDGESIILSAPTSFGKSAILDALIASEKWRNIVAIVPTLALIDETRRRLVRFSDRYTIITHPRQKVDEKNVYVLTQERFLELPDVPDVDLFMIDEFYKLGFQNSEDQRMSLLNVTWNQLRSTGAQYYLTGPNVDSLADTLSPELKKSLFVSNYRTVAVDVDDRSHIADEARISDMKSYWSDLDGSTLVFVSAPARAERVATELASFDSITSPNVFCQEVATWLAQNFHPSWRVVKALKRGVGTHTGPMPRSLQRMMIRLFNERKISNLVCTTTLIEGVNTTAKNVVVYDKKIGYQPIDYFTFNNIQGRAGRMLRHYVGRVITYTSPPEKEVTEVDFPIESQSGKAPLSSLVHISDKQLTEDSRLRLNEVVDESLLSLETIKENKGFDPAMQVDAARKLKSNQSLRKNFAWNRYPASHQVRAVLDFGLNNLLTSRQRRGMNVDRLLGIISAVRHAKGDLETLVTNQYKYRRDREDGSDVVASMLSFQRNWMGFTIPSLLRVTQRIYNEVACSLGETQANYEYYISQVENLFLDPGLLELDEYGLPLPLALRFSEMGMISHPDIAVVIESFISLARNKSVRSQLSSIELWIVDDVLEGLNVKP